RVLRLRSGDPVVLFDGRGSEFPGKIVSLTTAAVTVAVGPRQAGRPDPVPAITLATSLLKADRFDWVVQKATELGVARIIPLLAERTVVSFRDGQPAGRVARWERIAIEAAEQSGRVTVPEIDEPRRLATLIGEITRQPTVVCWENEHRTSLDDVLPRDVPELLLIVGPEGGLTHDEVYRLVAAGARAASLGPLVLRSETAAVAGVAGVLALASARRSRDIS
ncbi:MAG TPA: 16S rRNA (uracil(1498)-N(3))-methyltransferase, partial [Thermomicrobiaceae bacterium]|nr:16S rRNA (uracil(1498)-N(3))-methyltransferase [Thermomicrobiaceae bacterium]